MEAQNIYRDIARRCAGDIYIGDRAIIGKTPPEGIWREWERKKGRYKIPSLFHGTMDGE